MRHGNSFLIARPVILLFLLFKFITCSLARHAGIADDIPDFYKAAKLQRHAIWNWAQNLTSKEGFLPKLGDLDDEDVSKDRTFREVLKATGIEDCVDNIQESAGLPLGFLSRKKNETRLLWKLGPSGFFEVPFIIKKGDFSEYMIKNRILWGMAAIEQGSNIRFRLANTSDKNMIIFINGEGCLSIVGRHPREIPQRISLNVPNCMHHHSVLHEILHALGLFHEHQRADSVNFIEPTTDAPEKWLPHVTSDPNIPTHLTPYNIASIMHYNLFLKAKNPLHQSVLETRSPALSSCDWHQLNLLYPGPKQPGRCVPHEHVRACEPLENCSFGDILCRYMCDMDCDIGLPAGDITNVLGPIQPFCQFVGGLDFPPLPEELNPQKPHF